MVEFDCCECGRHICSFVSDRPPEPPLCGLCQFVPGWFRDPNLRAVLDPSHDGRDRSVPQDGSFVWPERSS